MKVDGIVTGIQTNYDYDPISRIKADAINKQNEASKAEEDAKKKVIEETEKVASEVYGDVLSASTDGDTTSAAKQSMAALSDGLVMQKSNVAEVTTTLKEPAKTEPAKTEPAKVQPEENTNPVLEAAKEDAKKARNEEQIDSLTGYTSSQLDSLYAQGKISRIDYDQEISRRDELTKQQNTPAVEEEQEDEDNKENGAAEQIKQQIEGNGAINNEMAGLVNQQINSDLTGISVDAIQSADGDKINLINQIVNGN